MTMNIFKSVCIVFVFWGILNGATLFSQEVDSTESANHISNYGDDSSMNWGTQTLRVKGNGFGPEKVKSLGRRKILAKRAAKLDAFRNLIEAIKGVYVTSNTRVEEMMLVSDSIKARTDGMLKGMRVVDITYSEDGGCEISVEVNIDKGGRFLLNALNSASVTVKDDYPKFDWIAMREELEKTKIQLASAKTDAKKFKKKLKSTQFDLSKTNKELKEAKFELANLKNEFDQSKAQLAQANKNLEQLEGRLNHANSSKSILKKELASVKNELNTTQDVLGEMTDKLNRKETILAVNQKELELTKSYLAEKQEKLRTLSKDLAKHDARTTLALLNLATFQGYVQRLKDIQNRSSQRIDHLFSYPSNQNNDNILYSKNYTGLLIDARGLNLKPVLAPSILTPEKKKIYGIGVIPTKFPGGSLAGYLSGDIDQAKRYKRIGDHPLVLKGIESVNETDIIISEEDIQKLALIIDQLELTRVGILI